MVSHYSFNLHPFFVFVSSGSIDKHLDLTDVLSSIPDEAFESLIGCYNSSVSDDESQALDAVLGLVAQAGEKSVLPQQQQQQQQHQEDVEDSLESLFGGHSNMFDMLMECSASAQEDVQSTESSLAAALLEDQLQIRPQSPTPPETDKRQLHMQHPQQYLQSPQQNLQPQQQYSQIQQQHFQQPQQHLQLPHQHLQQPLQHLQQSQQQLQQPQQPSPNNPTRTKRSRRRNNLKEDVAAPTPSTTEDDASSLPSIADEDRALSKASSTADEDDVASNRPSIPEDDAVSSRTSSTPNALDGICDLLPPPSIPSFASYSSSSSSSSAASASPSASSGVASPPAFHGSNLDIMTILGLNAIDASSPMDNGEREQQSAQGVKMG